MELSVFCLAYAGAALLCLAMDRHHIEVFGARPPRLRKLGLRILGCGLMAGSLAASAGASGWRVGAVEWVGALGLAGVALIFQHGFRPRWTPAVGVLCMLLAIALMATNEMWK